MGNWHISVRGVGMHHNNSPLDANEMARVFTEALKVAGHQVLGAAFTYGAEDNLEHFPPAVPLSKEG